jgi:hypothetical protein
MFIELQKKSFDKFAGEYNFTVIDNSIDETFTKQIDEICQKHDIRNIQTVNKFDSRKNGLHGFSHEVGINTFLDELKKNHKSDDIVILLDHDVFLVSELSKILNLILSSSVLTIKQERQHIYYIWPGLAIFNLKNCVNIDELSLDGAKLINGTWVPIDNGVFTDVGGHSFHYLKKYSDTIKFVDIMNFFVQNFEELNDNHIFFHFHDGSQWSGYSNEIWDKKFENLNNIIK